MPEDRFSAALAYAACAHQGQVYHHPDGDQPYVLHCLRVALRCKPEHQVVALLHDVSEDTDYGLPIWLHEAELRALMLLTRDKAEETYDDYITAIMIAPGEAGAIARSVKIEDLRENYSCAPPGRLRERCAKALTLLALV